VISDSDLIQKLDAQADQRVNRINKLVRDNEWGEGNTRVPYPFIKLQGSDLDLYQKGLTRLAAQEEAGTQPGDTAQSLLNHPSMQQLQAQQASQTAPQPDLRTAPPPGLE